MKRTRLAALCVAGALALAGCGGDEETTAPAPEVGGTGASGPGGPAQGDAGKPASDANDEGKGAGLEQGLSGADVSGTDTEAGQQATTGDASSE